MGNARAKAIWEANVPSNYEIPRESDPQSVIKRWIVAKYEYKEFMVTLLLLSIFLFIYLLV